MGTLSIDKFVVFKPKNDRELFITRESRLPTLKHFDENVFLKPMKERTEEEKDAPLALDDADIAFINKHSSRIHFRQELVGARNMFVADFMNISVESLQKVCDELNEAMGIGGIP